MTRAKGNNASAGAPPLPGRVHTGHVREEGKWDGNELWFRGRWVGGIVQDKQYPNMWRVRLPNGQLSDMVNRLRAKDAAVTWASEFWGL